jgi:hypothetical protein
VGGSLVVILGCRGRAGIGEEYSCQSGHTGGDFPWGQAKHPVPSILVVMWILFVP